MTTKQNPQPQVKYDTQLKREYRALGLANRIQNKQRRKEWRSVIMHRINILRRRKLLVVAFMRPECNRPELERVDGYGRIR